MEELQSPTASCYNMASSVYTQLVCTIAKLYILHAHFVGEKTALVECGVFSRPVTFSGDYSSLEKAIIGTFSFSGLELHHIALLQIKSTEESFQGNFVDIVEKNIGIEDNSVVKVVLYCKVWPE
jgi:hypothetical protein